MSGRPDKSQSSYHSAHSTTYARAAKQLGSVTKIIDFYQNDPHLCLTKVYEFIDDHPEVYHSEQKSIYVFERRFLEKLNGPKSDADLAVERIKEAQRMRQQMYKRPDYEIKPNMRVSNRIPQLQKSKAQIQVTRPQAPRESFDLNIKIGGLVKRRLSSRGRSKPEAKASAKASARHSEEAKKTEITPKAGQHFDDGYSNGPYLSSPAVVASATAEYLALLPQEKAKFEEQAFYFDDFPVTGAVEQPFAPLDNASKGDQDDFDNDSPAEAQAQYAYYQENAEGREEYAEQKQQEFDLFEGAEIEFNVDTPLDGRPTADVRAAIAADVLVSERAARPQVEYAAADDFDDDFD